MIYARFSLKDIGRLYYFLGVAVFHSPDGLILFQRKYILDLVVEHNIQESNGMVTPVSSSLALTIDQNSSAVNITE